MTGRAILIAIFVIFMLSALSSAHAYDSEDAHPAINDAAAAASAGLNSALSRLGYSLDSVLGDGKKIRKIFKDGGEEDNKAL